MKEGSITLRRSKDRGAADHGWLRSRHTFSFADYFDPVHMGYRALRVINDDIVAAGKGFDTHPHRDMEIITYVLSGALEHRDSMGNGSIIHPGDVQRMSAGTGVLHSEFNPQPDADVRLLQIWILPDEKGLPPEYEQKHFTVEERTNRLRLIASKNGADGSVTVHQDVQLYAVLLDPQQSVRLPVEPGRHIWVQAASGSFSLNGTVLNEGDGAAVENTDQLELTGITPSELLIFDLD